MDDSQKSDAFQHFSQKGAELVNGTVLPKLLSKNLPVRDCYHIIARAKLIFAEKFEKLKYSDPTITKLRKAMLKSLIEDAKSRKVEKPKEKDKEMQEKADRCEPVAREIVDMILDTELLMAYEPIIDTIVSDQEAKFIADLVTIYFSHVDNWLVTAMKENERKANLKKWDGKNPEEITWKDLDNALL